VSKRSIVYIDGFNLYYGALKSGPHRWFDIEKYFTRLRQDDDVQLVRYFTALVTDDDGRARQLTYLRALATLPRVQVHLGKFKPKSTRCLVKACSQPGARRFSVFEEKRTDVNIAIHMLDDSYQDACDRLVVVSGDSDLVPALHAVKLRFPAKEIVVYVPARDLARGAATELRTAADRNRTMPLALIPHCQLPTPIPGATPPIVKPLGW
jgi:6-hydroxy-3-succinoylpyridine 3-monooxygenase